MKRSQEGSAGSLVVVLVIAGLIYWQWDWIAGLFGSKLAMGGTVAEVMDYRCERQSDGRMRIDGTVKNTSESPLELRAVTAIYDAAGKKSDYSEATVRPVPLKPGQVGTFRAEAPALPDGGSCRLDGLLDSITGRPARYSGGRR